MLAALGLSKEEESVYRYLVTDGPVTREEVGTGTGLRGECADAALAGLETREFAYRLTSRPERFAAAPPGTVETVIADRVRELHTAQASLTRMAAQHRARQLALEGSGAFEMIRGEEALRWRSMRLQHSARFEALTMLRPPIAAVCSGGSVGSGSGSGRARPGEAVRRRFIYDAAALEDAGFPDTIRQTISGTDEVRVHTGLPAGMLAIDRSIALVPLAGRDAIPAGALIREGAVLDAFLALFEHVWATSLRLHRLSAGPRSPAAQLSAENRQLLSLLLSGLTNEAIAARLRVSERTIERKVRALMTAANVRTRMQLAWEAARQGWA